MKYFLCLSTVLFSITTFATINLENAKQSGEINFLAIGKPAMIRIKGKAPAPVTKAIIENNKMSVESNLVLKDLDTGIGLRDEHMKDNFLQVKEYPTALLKIENITLPDGFETKPTTIKNQAFQGKLTLHGKEQIITGIFSLNESLELVAKFSIKLTDFGIEIPSYLGVNVADTVAIDTNFTLSRKDN
ncbi:MAG: YceI family protein [Bacteriovorax sp.]|nr:YceI family protein [Bacteriovorax sp.]